MCLDEGEDIYTATTWLGLLALAISRQFAQVSLVGVETFQNGHLHIRPHR